MRKLIENNINDKTFWDIQYSPNRREDYRNKNIVGYRKYEKVLEYIKNGDKVLDIACGFAISAINVKEEYIDCDVWAFDQVDMVDDLAKEYPDIHFQKAEIGKEDLPNDFDVIIAFDVIEHVDDPDFLIKDAASHLKTDGKLIISTPDGDVKPFAGSPEHIWLLTHEDMDKLYTTNGFLAPDYAYLEGKEGVLFMFSIGVKKC